MADDWLSLTERFQELRDARHGACMTLTKSATIPAPVLLQILIGSSEESTALSNALAKMAFDFSDALDAIESFMKAWAVNCDTERMSADEERDYGASIRTFEALVRKHDNHEIPF